LISAIIPARNEEASIARAVESVAGQAEVVEVIVVDDESRDGTGAILAELARRIAKLKVLSGGELPAGWVGKNHAASVGAAAAEGNWLLFTDADTYHHAGSACRALADAAEHGAVLVSYSPEQELETWGERTLIPFVYCRLAERFSYTRVNDSELPDAAANGQYLLIQREVYRAVGGHAAVGREVLEDVALARRVKVAGYKIYFAGGAGIVRTRMYRSFEAMWQGWTKNLYPLMGGNEAALGKEFVRAALPVMVAVIAAVSTWGFESVLGALGVLAIGIIGIFVAYEGELKRNQFSNRLIWYGIPGRLLFTGVLWASYRGYRRGKLEWKGRAYPVGTPRASKG